MTRGVRRISKTSATTGSSAAIATTALWISGRRMSGPKLPGTIKTSDDSTTAKKTEVKARRQKLSSRDGNMPANR